MSNSKKRLAAKKHKQRHNNARLAYKQTYPYIRINQVQSNVNSQFAEAVQKAINLIDFNSSQFTDAERATIALYNNPRQLVIDFAKLDSDKPGASICITSGLEEKIGDTIYNAIDKDKLEKWSPFNIFVVNLKPEKIKIDLFGLTSTNGRKGSIYYSQAARNLQIGGQSYKIGWSRHAVTRSSRFSINTDTNTYAGAYTAYCSMMYSNKIVELSCLGDGTQAFTCFEQCFKDHWTSEYVHKVLGKEEFDPNFDYYYRVGYYPYVIDGTYVVALTALQPGYKGTPEWKAINKLPFNEHQRLKEKCQRFTTSQLYTDESNYDLIKWYHENGPKQIITIPTQNKTVDLPHHARRILFKSLGNGPMARWSPTHGHKIMNF